MLAIKSCRTFARGLTAQCVAEALQLRLLVLCHKVKCFLSILLFQDVY